jgi:carboxypeptidase Q
VPWSPSTNGTITAAAVNLIAPTGPEAPPNPNAAGRGPQGPTYLGPTEDELNAYLASMASKVKGAIVLVGASQVPPFTEVEPPKRQDDATVRARYADPSAPPAAGRGNRAGGRGAQPGEPVRLTGAQVTQHVNDFLMKSGAAMRVNDANRPHGIIVAQNPPAYDSTKQLPSVILRNEDYGRIARILADGTPVTLEFTIVNHVYPEGKTSYDVVAEIPGTDKADEVVMLGGHLDSWTSATGATDNGIGCAIMMEAARILETIGAKPRRTIRVALWSGEEEGLLGSLAYVEKHFGTVETPKPEFAKLDAYWNIDSGTGRVRGASIFGPPEGALILAQFLKPFEDLGVYGAVSTNSRATGGTDSTSYNHAGLPGIGASQDSIEYGTHTHHTNLDTYERILPDDVKKDAVITASVVLHIANRDQMMPRFTKDQMPPLPGGRGGGTGPR